MPFKDLKYKLHRHFQAACEKSLEIFGYAYRGYIALNHSWEASLIKGDTARVKKYLEKDPSLANKLFKSPEIGDDEPGLPLSEAVAWNYQGSHYGVVKALLECGAKQDTTSSLTLPLMRAVDGHDLELVSLLLEYDTSTLNAVCEFRGLTALGVAAYNDAEEYLAIAEVLLKAGASQDVAGQKKTPLESAQGSPYRGKEKMVSLLKNYAAKKQPPKPAKPRL